MNFSALASDAMIQRFGIDVLRHHDYKRCHRHLTNAVYCCGIGSGLAAAGLGLALGGAYEAAAAALVASLAIIPVSWYMDRRFRVAVQA